MKTWKTLLGVCRGKKTGKFAHKGKCGMFRKAKVRRVKSKRGQSLLFN